jgi:hypothetical protein
MQGFECVGIQRTGGVQSATGVSVCGGLGQRKTTTVQRFFSSRFGNPVIVHYRLQSRFNSVVRYDFQATITVFFPPLMLANEEIILR